MPLMFKVSTVRLWIMLLKWVFLIKKVARLKITLVLTLKILLQNKNLIKKLLRGEQKKKEAICWTKTTRIKWRKSYTKRACLLTWSLHQKMIFQIKKTNITIQTKEILIINLWKIRCHPREKACLKDQKLSHTPNKLSNHWNKKLITLTLLKSKKPLIMPCNRPLKEIIKKLRKKKRRWKRRLTSLIITSILL